MRLEHSLGFVHLFPGYVPTEGREIEVKDTCDTESHYYVSGASVWSGTLVVLGDLMETLSVLAGSCALVMVLMPRQ